MTNYVTITVKYYSNIPYCETSNRHWDKIECDSAPLNEPYQVSHLQNCPKTGLTGLVSLFSRPGSPDYRTNIIVCLQVDVLSEDEGEIMMLVPPDAVVSTSQLQENV